MAPAAPTVPLAPVLRHIPGFPSPPGGWARLPLPVPARSGMPLRDHVDRLAAPLRSLLASLPADPRLPRWTRRAVISIVVGAVCTALLDWPAGLAAAGITVGADVLFCSRTSAVIPATVRATSARRRTRRRLARLSPSGHLALHARLIPGSGSVIDHLVVGPAGVYAVDSQRWDRRLPVRSAQGGRLYHGPFEQSGRLEQARWKAGEASRLIGDTFGRQVTVRPAMVIYGPTVPWSQATIGGVDVFCGRRLRRYLRHEMCANRARRLDERQIELIHAVAAQVLPPAR